MSSSIKFGVDGGNKLTISSSKKSDYLFVNMSGYNYASLSINYEDAEKLRWWLWDWMMDIRERCSDCKHERAGCQAHDV